jgi:hypothetical protein
VAIIDLHNPRDVETMPERVRVAESVALGATPNELLAAHPEFDGVTDADFARIVGRGTLIGVPLAYVLSFLIVLTGADLATSAAAAILPAIFGGTFLGATVMLVKRLRAMESRLTVLDPALEHREAAFAMPPAEIFAI